MFTVVIAISIPATRGFWNIGEAGVYISALIAGPVIGGIAGGVGSALADVFLGYAYYAPGTLVIKGAEGFITGFIYHSIIRRIRGTSEPYVSREEIGYEESIEEGYVGGYIWRLYICILVSSITGVVIFVTYLFGSEIGFIDVSLVFEPLGRSIEFRIHFAYLMLFICILGGATIVLILLERELHLMILACLLGGFVMVFGYFVYETLILSGEVALIEVLPNFMQSIIGIILAIPVVKKLEEMGALDKYRELMGEV